MAPPASLFEFTYHDSVASLEVPIGRPASELEKLALGCDAGESYKHHLFPVRGKLRRISVPNSALNVVHGRINALLFPADLAMGKEVNGFVARRSTYTNALPHKGARHLQKFDIKDFFGSIRTAQIDAAVREIGFGADSAAMISRLVSCAGRLPLGARTSPRISNLVLRSFDEAMVALVEDRSIVYTRYADDLSFSSMNEFNVHGEVESQLKSRGFELNPSKVKLFKHGQPMFVTGLAVSDQMQPRLRKRFKRQLRREFYFTEVFGLAGHAEAIDEHPQSAANRMMGQFHYARSIEPEFAAKLAVAYPTAFRELIPERSDGRIERAQRHQQDFLEKVASAPAATLPFYAPVASYRRGG